MGENICLLLVDVVSSLIPDMLVVYHDQEYDSIKP